MNDPLIEQLRTWPQLNENDRSLMNMLEVKVDFPPHGYFDWLAKVKGVWAAANAVNQWIEWQD